MWTTGLGSRIAERSIYNLYTLFRLNDHKSQSLDRLEKEVVKLKEDINAKSEELDFRQRCLQEFQMMAIEKQVRHVGDASRQEQLRRRSEIFFRYDLRLKSRKDKKADPQRL